MTFPMPVHIVGPNMVPPPLADGYVPPAPVVVQDLQAVLADVTKAKSLLYLDHPFFGATVAKRPIIYTETVSTAAMSATGQMYINPTFIENGLEGKRLTIRQVMFLLAHEALHYMLCHATRRGARLPRAWNIAADKVINDTLVHAKVGDPIEGGVYMDGARDMCAEELYEPADEDEDDGGGTPGTPNGGIGNDIGGPVDDGGQPLDESQIHAIEAQAKIEAIQSMKSAKAVGKMPAALERQIDKMVNVKTPWDVILERWMTGKIRNSKSWKTPNKKFISKKVYLKGRANTPKMGPMVIGVDTSGSIGQPELDEFNGHINRILHTCNPEMVYVVYCDDGVNSVQEYEPDDFPVTLKLQGGGGTSFEPVFDWVDENGIDPEVVVYLTDGYGDQNRFTTKHETVWLTTHNEDFSWGTVIPFESEAA